MQLIHVITEQDEGITSKFRAIDEDGRDENGTDNLAFEQGRYTRIKTQGRAHICLPWLAFFGLYERMQTFLERIYQARQKARRSSEDSSH